MSDQLFINLNHPDWVNTKTIDQNRLLAGINIQASPSTTFIVSYLNQRLTNQPNKQINNATYFGLVFDCY